jgi:hypothetical protein
MPTPPAYVRRHLAKLRKERERMKIEEMQAEEMQVEEVMAMVVEEPEIDIEHVLRCRARGMQSRNGCKARS